MTYLPIAKKMNKNISRKLMPIWLIDRILTSYQWISVRNNIIERYNPDILHIQSMTSVLDQYFLPKLKDKLKMVLTVHDVLPITNSKANNNQRALKKIYDLADEIIVHSKTNMNELVNVFNIETNKIHIIPHGVIPPEKIIDLNKAKEYLNLDQNKKYILIFGGLRKSKGIDLALKSFSILHESYSEINMIIAGSITSDTNINELYDLAKKLNIENNIVWRTEYIPDKDVQYYFSASDIVLLPYIRFHSQSGVLLQAYKYYKPVVVTNVGSLGETVIKDGSGIVCNTFEPNEISGAIEKLLNDDNLYFRCSKNQQKLVNEEYNWINIAKKTIEVYNMLLNK